MFSSIKTPNISSCQSQQICAFKQPSLPILNSCLECKATGHRSVSFSPHQNFQIIQTFRSLCFPRSWALCIPHKQQEKGQVYRIVATNSWGLANVYYKWDLFGHVRPELVWPTCNWPQCYRGKEWHQSSKTSPKYSGYSDTKIWAFSGFKDTKHCRWTSHLARQ